MPRLNRQNIDRKTNKPDPIRTEGLTPDLLLRRTEQGRRDDDVIRTAKRTILDIDYAIKWFIDNEIRPQIIEDEQLIPVPVIFANGEKWDNVRRLGYMRDEKGMLQSPAIMLKRSSVAERDSLKTLDVNRPQSENVRVYKTKYNERNRYSDALFPIPTNKPLEEEKIYVVDIPKYVTVEYEMLLWCNFTEQLNEMIDQILPYGRFAWGNEDNKFTTTIGSISFETVNTIGEDRLVRATIPLTVHGTLLSEQEARISTIKKMYSIKKLVFENFSGDNDVLVERNRMESVLYDFKEPFRLSGLTNNLGFTPTEVYVTALFRNGNGYFNYPPKVGYKFNFHDTWIDRQFSGTTSNETGLSGTTFTRDSFTFTSGNTIPIDTILNGAFVEYNPKEMKERIVSESFHKITNPTTIFDHSQTVGSLNASSDNLEGLIYQPHYRVKLRELSPYVETATTNDIFNLPENTNYDADENVWRWRDIYDHGYVDQDGYGTNFPFVNGTHYVRTNINFYLRNERYYTNKQDGVTNFNNRKNINC